MDGKTVPMILRWERGVINRFMYSIMMLVAGARRRGDARPLGLEPEGALQLLRRRRDRPHQGAASAAATCATSPACRWATPSLYSTGNRTNTHYNLQLGGETAIMVKDRFVSAYAEPEYTIGVGGSGGAIQQYVYGQNHPGLLDGGRPAVLVPGHGHADDPRRRLRAARALDGLEGAREPALDVADVGQPDADRGLERSATFPNPYAAVMPYMPVPGSTECINGWRGLSPLALNPNFGTAPGYNPAVHGPVEWTHWGDLVNIYGTDETGFARSPWDNVGVQYGLAALQAGSITPEQFLDLNANVGSWKASKDMVQEGCPFIAAPLRHAGARRVERPQHEPLARRWRHAGRASRGEPGGGLCRLPLGDGLPGQARHPGDRLAPLPRAPARHAQLAPVVRLTAAAARTTTATRRTS